MIIAGLVLQGLILLIGGAVRSVLRRAAPLLLASASALAVGVSMPLAPLLATGPETGILLSLSIALVVFVAVYLALRRLLRRDLREPPATQRPLSPAPVISGGSVSRQHLPYEPLPDRRKFWKREPVPQEERFKHTVAYLRMAVEDQRASLDFSEQAIVDLWRRGSPSLEAANAAAASSIAVWLNECERTLPETSRMSRAQHLLQCERLVDNLLRIAVTSQARLRKGENSMSEILAARSDRLGEL
ncbi:MAG: hypothetical protein RIB52_06865 [Erythrobacter sp.]